MRAARDPREHNKAGTDATMTKKKIIEQLNTIDREVSRTHDVDAAFIAYRLLSKAILEEREEEKGGPATVARYRWSGSRGSAPVAGIA
jgi:hypothetical protein